MSPAFSVIFLTTLIGAAQGLFLALMAGQVYSDIGVLVEADEILFFTYGTVIISVFMGLVLFSTWAARNAPGARLQNGKHPGFRVKLLYCLHSR